MLTILLVIAILVFLIVVHELGHFIAAKIFRVRVDEFGVGFPPRAFSFGRIGETEYTLNWIPLGGFVRLFGEEEEHGRGSLADAERWKQAIILVSGVAMNAITAWVLFTGAYAIGILHPVAVATPESRLIVSDVLSGSPADAAGMKTGDEVLAVHDISGVQPDPLSPEKIAEYVSERGGKEITIHYMRAGITATAEIRPAHAVIRDEAGRPAIGLGLAYVTNESLPITDAAVQGFYLTLGTFTSVWNGLESIAADAFRGDPNLSDVIGPVGLVGVVDDATTAGWGYVLSLAAFISVNLTIINLIPIPALDGGRLVIVGIESVIRRQAPRLFVQALNTVGIALIILLMLTVTYQDIARLLA